MGTTSPPGSTRASGRRGAEADDCSAAFAFSADRNDATLMARQVRSHYNQEVCGNKLKPRRTHCVASENSW